MATNWLVVVLAMLGSERVTAIETRSAAVTVRVAGVALVMELSDAEIVTDPVSTVVARPGVAPPVSIVARELDEELHVAAVVMFCVVPSE